MVVIFISFSADSFIVFPPSGFSLRWYERLLAHEALMRGLRLSLVLAAIVTVLSLLVGVPAALALARSDGAAARALRSFFLAPLVLPTLVLGLALLMALQPLRLTATLPGLALGISS